MADYESLAVIIDFIREFQVQMTNLTDYLVGLKLEKKNNFKLFQNNFLKNIFYIDEFYQFELQFNSSQN